jgi:two-component system, NarL family, sensor kinase
MKMFNDTIVNNNINEVIGYLFIAFLLMAGVLILFFYFSRKKIIQKEIEKKNLEINHQKELLRSVILTQESERKRIAQDLHDDISSKLNVVSLNTHLLKTPNLSDDEILEITNNITGLTQKALESSRRIAHDLLPPVLEKFGLNAGIEELIVEVSSSKLVKVNYINHLKFDFDETERHLHIFRILQELLNNSIRHGNATEIAINFDTINGVETSTYIDNGKGFDISNKESQKGLGMKNIESRVNFLNGTLAITSKVNEGVKVIFTF